MEIWYDDVTMQVRAVYDDKYNGTVWGDEGLVSFFTKGKLPPGITPGAIIDFDVNGVPEVVTPAPPVTRPRTRIDDLRDKLRKDTITFDELKELLKLTWGL